MQGQSVSLRIFKMRYDPHFPMFFFREQGLTAIRTYPLRKVSSISSAVK